MRSFQDIVIGEQAKVRHTVTAQDVHNFATLTGDDNRLHVDAEFAATTQFARPVAHGMLGASFISTLIGTKLPGDGALWHRQTLDFLRPVFVDDRLTVTAVVTAKQSRTRTIVLDIVIRNQQRQVVTRGEAHVKLLELRSTDTLEAKVPGVEVGGIVVFGGSGGIGAAVAEKAVQHGYAVAVHCHNSRSSAETLTTRIKQQKGTAIVVEADVRSEEEMQEAAMEAATRLGGLKGLVYSVTGSLDSTDINDLTWADFQKTLDVELRGAWNAVHAVLPHLKEAGGGSIVLLTTQAVDTPNADWIPYITAKAAVEGLARSLAIALAPYSIRVNLVAPGMTETSLIAGIPSIARTRVQATAPLKRLATPADVAGAVVWLLSQDSRYCTGETIRINGGQVMR